MQSIDKRAATARRTAPRHTLSSVFWVPPKELTKPQPDGKSPNVVWFSGLSQSVNWSTAIQEERFRIHKLGKLREGRRGRAWGDGRDALSRSIFGEGAGDWWGTSSGAPSAGCRCVARASATTDPSVLSSDLSWRLGGAKEGGLQCSWNRSRPTVRRRWTLAAA